MALGQGRHILIEANMTQCQINALKEALLYQLIGRVTNIKFDERYDCKKSAELCPHAEPLACTLSWCARLSKHYCRLSCQKQYG